MTTNAEKKKRPYYVDNKKFLQEMIDFKESIKEAEKN